MSTTEAAYETMQQWLDALQLAEREWVEAWRVFIQAVAQDSLCMEAELPATPPRKPLSQIAHHE